MSFLNGLFLFFAGQGFFLAFLLIQNKKVKSNPWISLLIGCFSLVLIYWVLWWQKVPAKYLYSSFNVPIQLAMGPFYYLAILQKKPKIYSWHLLLPAICFIIMLPYFAKVFLSAAIPQFYGKVLAISIPVLGKVIKFSLLFYLIIAIKHVKSREQIWLTLSFAVFFLGLMLYLILQQFGLLVNWFDYTLALFITITFYSSGYYYFISYRPYSIKFKEDTILPVIPIAELEETIIKQKKYLKPKYQIGELSRDTGLPIKELTAIIKSNGHSSFKDYINKFRIEHSKFLLKKTNLKILAIALESGFTNKVSFILNFKRHTGTTPHEYRGK